MSKYNLIDIYEEFKAGDMFSSDFDYDGMLKAGLETGVDTDLETLKKLSDSFTDVNYHREADHLYKAIEALEDGATKEASMFFGDFHAEIKNTMKEQGMDIEPTVGQFMASKMEEGEDVKEVTSRVGFRIEGDLDIEKKAKFLDAFVDLFQSLEDPYFAEDVVDHLANEMLKHLDAIQAQGDALNNLKEKKDKKLPKEFADAEKAAAEKDAKKATGAIKEANEDYDLLKIKMEIRNKLDLFDEGSIDGEALANDIEEIVFDRRAPGMREENKVVAEITTFHTKDLDAKIKNNPEFSKSLEKATEKALKGDSTDLANLMNPSLQEGDPIIDEAVFGPVEFLKDKGIDEEAIVAFMEMHAEDIIGASEEEIADEFVNFATVNPEYYNDAVEDLNYSYKNSRLREHFARFLKDYQ